MTTAIMIKNFLKYACLAALFFAAAVSGAEKPRVEVAAEPTEVRAGGTVLVSIAVGTADVKGRPELPEVPGGRWLANRTNVAQSHKIGRASCRERV